MQPCRPAVLVPMLAFAAVIPKVAGAQIARPLAADPPVERMVWVRCRAIAPATLQLIWHGVRTASGYTIEVARGGGRGAAVIGTFTTGDTTYTQGSLPAGSVEVSVSYFVRMKDWPRAGDSAVVYPGRRGAGSEVLTGVVTFPVPSGQTHSCR